MHSVYQMFVGDARPHDNDTWLLSIIESIDKIIIPAVRMAVKLHEVSQVFSHLPTYVCTYVCSVDLRITVLKIAVGHRSFSVQLFVGADIPVNSRPSCPNKMAGRQHTF